MEIIKDAIGSGHKILLFSGYSSIFGFIEKDPAIMGKNVTVVINPKKTK